MFSLHLSSATAAPSSQKAQIWAHSFQPGSFLLLPPSILGSWSNTRTHNDILELLCCDNTGNIANAETEPADVLVQLMVKKWWLALTTSLGPQLPVKLKSQMQLSSIYLFSFHGSESCTWAHGFTPAPLFLIPHLVEDSGSLYWQKCYSWPPLLASETRSQNASSSSCIYVWLSRQFLLQDFHLFHPGHTFLDFCFNPSLL